MGLIYCITFPCGKKYIGQTRQILKKRIAQHLSSNDNTLISRAFRKYKDFTSEILLECENSVLDEQEIYFIEKYNTIVPLGYNMRSGGQNGYHFSIDVRKKCSLNARKSCTYLPMYIYKTVDGFRCRPPGKPEKYFNQSFLEVDLKLLLAKEYLEGKDELYNKYIKPNDLPKFISKIIRTNRSGYRVTYPGFEKHFTSMKITDEDKYILAINYLNLIKEKVQRLNGSGEK